MGNDERILWIGLNSVKGIGPVLYKRLIEQFGGPAEVFAATRSRLSAVDGLSGEAIDEIVHFADRADILREIRLMDEHSVGFVHYLHPQYPSRLKDIHDPPPYLYMLGDLWPQDHRSIAVVGSRKPTVYGKQAASILARDLARCQWTVVSGFATGIDQTAHRSALTAGGRTIAVLGCGIDVNYPPASLGLKEAIAGQGAVISEFPMGTSPSPGHFPRRNRLISGLSAGVLVVEAAEKSGSLITASMALEQGREVFAVPGSIRSDLSRGTHYLIKSGAKLVERVSDIFEELEGQIQVLPEEQDASMTPSLAPDEKKIYAILSIDPIHMDEISVRSGLTSQRCSEILLHLELMGLVSQVDGNRFVGQSSGTE